MWPCHTARQDAIGARQAETLPELLGCPDPAADHVRCDGCAEASPDGSHCADCDVCARCHLVVPEGHTIVTTRSAIICLTCRDARFQQCEGCDGWNRDDLDCGNGCPDDEDDQYEDEEDDEDEDGDGCGEGCVCRRSVDGRNSTILSYGFKPLPVFHGDGPLFLGPEIEIHAPDEDAAHCAGIANAHLDDLGYLKCDASIDPDFEIVTHPMSYAWAIEHFPWEMLPHLAEAGAYTSSATGLHVHLSRAGFSGALHVYRWMKFVYRNERAVTRLARRTSEFAEFTAAERRQVAQRAKGGYGERHTAINTNNLDTLELRVFASSLEPATVKAAFGFAASSVEYTRDLDVAAIAQCAGCSPSFGPAATELVPGVGV